MNLDVTHLHLDRPRGRAHAVSAVGGPRQHRLVLGDHSSVHVG